MFYAVPPCSDKHLSLASVALLMILISEQLQQLPKGHVCSYLWCCCKLCVYLDFWRLVAVSVRRCAGLGCSLPGGFVGAPSEAWCDQVETCTGLRQPTVAVNAVELCSRKAEMCLDW